MCMPGVKGERRECPPLSVGQGCVAVRCPLQDRLYVLDGAQHRQQDDVLRVEVRGQAQVARRGLGVLSRAAVEVAVVGEHCRVGSGEAGPRAARGGVAQHHPAEVADCPGDPPHKVVLVVESGDSAALLVAHVGPQHLAGLAVGKPDEHPQQGRGRSDCAGQHVLRVERLCRRLHVRQCADAALADSWPDHPQARERSQRVDQGLGESQPQRLAGTGRRHVGELHHHEPRFKGPAWVWSGGRIPVGEPRYVASSGQVDDQRISGPCPAVVALYRRAEAVGLDTGGRVGRRIEVLGSP